MPKRNIDTGLWSEGWFEVLSLDAKAIYNYLETNSFAKPCGIYIITLERIAGEFRITVPRVKKALKEMEPDVLYDHVKSMVFVRRFVKHQRNSQKWLIAVERSLNEIEPHAFVSAFLEEYQYFKIAYTKAIDTLSIAPDTDSPLVLDLKGGDARGGSPESALKESFDLFYAEYPNKKSPAAAFERWKKLSPAQSLIIKIMLALQAAKVSVDWTLPDGRLKSPEYIPHPSTWLNKRSWESVYTPRTPASYTPETQGPVSEADIDYSVLRAAAKQ